MHRQRLTRLTTCISDESFISLCQCLSLAEHDLSKTLIFLYFEHVSQLSRLENNVIDRYIVSQLFYLCSQTGSCIIICALISTTISCVCVILYGFCAKKHRLTHSSLFRNSVMFSVLQNTCQLFHHDSLLKCKPSIFALCGHEINRLFRFKILIIQKSGIRNL